MRSFLCAAGLAALVAASAGGPAGASKSGAYHILPTPSYEARTGRIPPKGFSGAMEYFGGTVFSSVEVVSVMWGPNVNQTTVADIPDFSAAIVNSTFIDQLAEYSTVGLTGVTGHKGSNQTISRGTYYGQVQITPRNKSLNLLDIDIHRELRHQIAIGALPPQGPNMLYMIYFPANVSINLDGLISCQQFGAYHFATRTHERPDNIFYSVEPECGWGFGYLTFAASHEFAEAVTDNIPTPGTNPAYPQAWNTYDGYEIGDLCGNTGTLTDSTTSYEVTQVYLNSLSNCSSGNYTSP
jgi:hypothetical protein